MRFRIGILAVVGALGVHALLAVGLAHWSRKGPVRFVAPTLAPAVAKPAPIVPPAIAVLPVKLAVQPRKLAHRPRHLETNRAVEPAKPPPPPVFDLEPTTVEATH